jgi:thiol-disulfide isomerase/thioredoxin
MKAYLIAWFSSIVLAASLAAEEHSILPLNSPAPDFDLPGVDGRNHTLKEFADAKVLAIVFTCNHCPTSQYYEHRIKQLVSDYTRQDVALVAISPNDPHSVRLDEMGWTDLGDSLPEMKLRAKHRDFNFPYLYDGDVETASRAYGPAATPHIFIFDHTRHLRYQGAIDDSERVQHVKVAYARNAIDALLADKQPPVTQTKVVGCSTKWKGKADLVKAYVEKQAAEPVSVEKIDAAGLQTLRKNDSGKFRLVNFWATWCAPCVAEFPELVTLNRMYRHRDFELVTVSINRPDEENHVLAFLKKQQASHKNYLFGSAERDKLMNAFDSEWSGAVPFTLLLDPEGKAVYREAGSIDPLAVKRAIVQAMNARKPW